MTENTAQITFDVYTAPKKVYLFETNDSIMYVSDGLHLLENGQFKFLKAVQHGFSGYREVIQMEDGSIWTVGGETVRRQYPAQDSIITLPLTAKQFNSRDNKLYFLHNGIVKYYEDGDIFEPNIFDDPMLGFTINNQGQIAAYNNEGVYLSKPEGVIFSAIEDIHLLYTLEDDQIYFQTGPSNSTNGSLAAYRLENQSWNPIKLPGFLMNSLIADKNGKLWGRAYISTEGAPIEFIFSSINGNITDSLPLSEFGFSSVSLDQTLLSSDNSKWMYGYGLFVSVDESIGPYQTGIIKISNDGLLSQHEFNPTIIDVVPNPSSHQVKPLGLPAGQFSYFLFGGEGKLLKKGSIQQEEEINISDLVQGQYFLILDNKHEIYRARFMKM